MRDDLSLQLAQHLLLTHDVAWLLLAAATPVEIQKHHRELHARAVDPGPEVTEGPSWQDRSHETGPHAG
jgi:hypothetical protein